jgi:RNA polymerase sigma factor (sigma-70 family)
MTGSEDALEDAGPPEVDVDRRGIVALVARTVRLRYALTADAFADRLIDWVRSLDPHPQGPLAQVGRLCLDDLYLATACARGEEAAWEECARHFAFVRDFARRYLREPEAADLADQVIADLWQRGKIARFDGRSTLRTWLGAVAAHAALNVLKAGRRQVPLESDELESWRRRQQPREDSSPGDHEIRAALGELVGEALRNMRAEDKLLVLLHYEQGLSLGEMGVVLTASKSTLSRRLKAARAELRVALDALAKARFGRSADALRGGVDLGRLEFDLGALIAAQAGSERTGPRLV